MNGADMYHQDVILSSAHRDPIPIGMRNAASKDCKNH